MPKFCTLISLLIFSLHLYASSDTALRSFTIENGLPSNNVYAVTQDKYGYMWFNTDDGVVKYNGYTFKLFTTADGLPSNDIWKLYPDKRGRLWASTHSNTIGYIKNDKYKPIITSKTKTILPSYINSDSSNVYFILGSYEHSTLVIVDSNDNVRMVPLDTGKVETILAAIGFDNALVLIKKDSTFYTRKLSDTNDKGHLQKMSISPWSFFLSGGGGLTYYGGQRMSISVQRNYFLFADTAVYFTKFGGDKKETIYISYQDNDSLTIITNAAVYRLNHNITAWRRIAFPIFLPKSAQVAYYFIDKFNDEWYATTNGVWCKYNLSELLHVDSKLNSLYNTKCIGQINNGNTYWYIKGSNIIYQIDTAKNIKQILPPDNSPPNRVVGKNDSEIYVVGSSTIYIYNNRNRYFKRFIDYYKIDTVKRYNLASEPYMLTDSVNLTYSFMGTGNIWQIAENRWILFNRKPSVRTVELYNHTMIFKGIDSERVKSMCYDSTDGVVIFFDLNKLSLYIPGLDKYINIDQQVLRSLKISSIQQIRCDELSNIYILDDEKIVMYNFRSHQIKYFKNNINLSNAMIAIYGKYLFAAGKFGVAYAKINGPLNVSEFHVAANMDNYKKVYDFVINNQGVIYLSTDKGLIDVKVNTLINRALINTNRDNLFMLNISFPIHRLVANNDTVSLSQDINKITFNTVNLLGNGSVQYNYNIEGYGNWEQTSTGEIVTGTLKAGHYYKVRCKVKDDAWVSKEFVFYIYRVPYWWQKTNWIIVFWISGILAFGGVIFIVMLLTRRVAAKANDKKRALTELELRAIYAQINPHFIFNTLSATLYFINKRKFDDAYLHINKFSRLIRGYLKSSQERYITLADEIEMLKNYIELQKTRFEDKLEYKIEVDNKVPVNNIQIPSLLLQPLVENAINHGLFHRKEGGVLLLQFLQGESSEELICIIDDNGVGRGRAKEIKESSTVQYDSYGTKLTKQLIDVFKEFEKMGITLEYIDKQLPETGTIVKLTIKNIKYVA